MIYLHDESGNITNEFSDPQEFLKHLHLHLQSQCDQKTLRAHKVSYMYGIITGVLIGIGICVLILKALY